MSHNEQPYLTPERVDRGWVLVFTGIEGRSQFNEAIADGLARGGVKYAIEIVDWTPSGSAIYNLEAQDHNRRTAAESGAADHQLSHGQPRRAGDSGGPVGWGGDGGLGCRGDGGREG